MANNAPDPTPPKGGGLWGRLFGMNPPRKPDPKPAEPPVEDGLTASPAPPTEEAPAEAPAEVPAEVPAAPAPVAPAAVADLGGAPVPFVTLPETPPEAVPEFEEAVQEAPEEPELTAVHEPFPPRQPAPFTEPVPTPVPAVATQAAPAALMPCPVCATPRTDGAAYCGDCGYMFGPNDRLSGAPALMPSPPPAPGTRLKDRYELLEQIGERGSVCRFRALDHASGTPVPVLVVRGALPEMAEALLLDEDIPVAAVEPVDDDLMPSFDEPMPVARVEASGAAWPSVGWEIALLEKAQHPTLPALLDTFADGAHEYLVEECPEGRSLWDAWDDPDVATGAEVRYGWLKQVAEGLQVLHAAGAIFEGIRPDVITVTDSGQLKINDLSDLLPLPIPPGTPMRATLYTAPELILGPDQADARADLYSFGAMLYSLEYLHHSLEEKDFERQFTPRLITDRYPDVHPAFFRLVCKTFVRDLNTRFPTDEAGREDATGFTELIRTLDACRRNFDNCRLDIASWTTTGMVRTGNEDAFTLLQAVESRQDDLTEYALVTLCDGMGGYEAGEVAAAMCGASLRTYLLGQPMFAAVAGKEHPGPSVFNVDQCKQVLKEALRHANKEVYAAARAPGTRRRGMGCTAEAVYVDNRNVVVGHVGDSRTYHLHNGRLIQLTRDQTFVNRMVELGQLTAEEAEEHPRKNELQQAIGGQPDVMPETYHGKLERGDWVLVCSDGLTNHVPTRDLEQMLREAYGSAEEVARRLLNLVNLRGATDNATIVVIRAT